jgi:hypothetical protein
MKYVSILALTLLTVLLSSACGAQAIPTTPAVNPVDLQNTMAAAALTMVAETQAAIPTSTATGTPTNTPLPTPTIPPLPTLDGTFTAVPSDNSGGAGDPCINQVLPEDLDGEPIRMRVDNSTRATVNLSVYLNSTTPGGQCGYRAYTLEPGQFVVINNLVEGCFTLWAWNPIPEEYFIATNGTNCLDSSGNWSFDITTGSIRLR